MGLSHESGTAMIEVVFWSKYTKLYWKRNGCEDINIWPAIYHLESVP